MKRSVLIDGLVLAASVGFTAYLLPWSLVLSPSIPAGGDTTSHFAALVHFKDYVLPQWRLWGWHPGNLAGFPLFQFYFPLPPLVIVGLSAFWGLAPAFKLGALIPALALPVSVYFCLRRLGLGFPGPAFGAAFSLSFLLAETNQVWGGNLASILAGEICYAWAFNLVPIYLGSLYAWMRSDAPSGRGAIRLAVLLLFIGLSHAYALLFALATGLYFLLDRGRFKAAALGLFVVYALAFLLLGLWLIPMLVYTPLTEMFNFVWVVDSWREFTPTTLLPVLVLAALAGPLAWRWGETVDRDRAGFLLFWVVAAASLYFLAPFMNSITIRFVPFAHLAAVLLAAQGLRLITRRLAGRGLVALIVVLASVVWTGGRMNYLDRWLSWNNAGLEATPAWSEVERLTEFLRPKGPAWEASRVVYEHSPLNDQAGTLRIFESLPILAGRATLEGAYLQASPNAPFIFYLQSEVSRRSSSPLPGYVYTRLNLGRAVEHMRLYNVGQYIVVEPETRKLADRQPGLILEREFGSYSVYRVLGNRDAYAVTPERAPVLVITDRPQAIAFEWFRFSDLKTPLVFARRMPAGAGERFAGVLIDSGRDDEALFKLIRENRLPKKELAGRPIVEKIAPERIELRGLQPGRPVVIKMSYHPAWRTLSGEEIFRVSPAFMLVFPDSDRLTLVCGPTWANHLGLALSVLGLILIGLLAWRPGLAFPLRPEPRGAERTGPRPWLTASLLVVWAIGLAGLWSRHDDASTILAKARALRAEGRLEEARAKFREGLKRFEMSVVVDYTWYDLAMTYYAGRDYAEAERLLKEVVRRFPDSILMPETLYHLGWCAEKQGRAAEAEAYWRRLRQEFPESGWAQEIEKHGS